jgi:sugar (glycoside-pentoside-hexuronide) transporter
MGQIIRYGFGGAGSNLATTFLLMYAATYFTNYLGISPLAMGTLLLVTKLVDAFIDPGIGMIADRTKTKIGRFRPYIIFGAPALGLTITALFTDWGAQGPMQLVLCYVLYILYSLATSFVNISYHALTPLMTADPNQRTTIVTVKQLIGFVAIIPLLVVFPQLLVKYPSEPRVFTYSAAVLAIIVTISFWICANGAKTKDTLQRIEKFEGKGKKEVKLPIKTQLQVIFKNKALLMLMLAFGASFIASGAASGSGIYYFRDVAGNTGLASMAGLLPMVAGIPLMLVLTPLTKKFGSKTVFIAGSAIQMLVSAWLFVIPYHAAALILVNAALAGFFMPLTSVLGWAIAADCVEYGEWKTGINGAGTVTSQISFINQSGTAIGGFLLGALLAAAGYDSALTAQAEYTKTMIVAIRALVPAAGFLISTIAMLFYPIKSSKEFDAIVKENEERRALKRAQE